MKPKVCPSIHITVSLSEMMKVKLLPLLVSDCTRLVNDPDLLIMSVYLQFHVIDLVNGSHL